MKTEEIVRVAIQERVSPVYLARLVQELNGKVADVAVPPDEEVVNGFFPADWRKQAEAIVARRRQIKLEDLRKALQETARMGSERATIACQLLEEHFRGLEGFLVRAGFVFSPLALAGR